MTHNVTTSIRLPVVLRARLDKVANKMHRGKNWIIIHALESYLENLQLTMLVKEAHRQSILACKSDKNETQSWEDNSDTTGWE